jgi:hypothetical protein
MTTTSEHNAKNANPRSTPPAAHRPCPSSHHRDKHHITDHTQIKSRDFTTGSEWYIWYDVYSGYLLPSLFDIACSLKIRFINI